jgi:hypothetical protein
MNNRKRLTRICAIGGILLLLAFVVSVAIPNFAGSHRSKAHAIVSNLRQLDGAMQQWGLDHGQTGTVVVTEENLVPYLRHPPKPVAGERYVLKTLAESPEAHLTHKVELWPAGSVLRLSTNGDFEVVSPNKTNAAKHGRTGS